MPALGFLQTAYFSIIESRWKLLSCSVMARRAPTRYAGTLSGTQIQQPLDGQPRTPDQDGENLHKEVRSRWLHAR
jgi:hypothetical protein